MMLVLAAAARGPDGGRVDPPFLFLALLPLVIVGGARGVQRGRDGRPGAGRPRRASARSTRCCAGSAPALAGHRAGVLPADPGRAGLRARASASCWAARRCSPRALMTAGVGPWLPFQMLVSAWIGMGAGLLPRRLTGRAEIAVLVGLRHRRVVRLRHPDEPVRAGPSPSASRSRATRARCRTSRARRCSRTCSGSPSTRCSPRPAAGTPAARSPRRSRWSCSARRC